MAEACSISPAVPKPCIPFHPFRRDQSNQAAREFLPEPGCDGDNFRPQILDEAAPGPRITQGGGDDEL